MTIHTWLKSEIPAPVDLLVHKRKKDKSEERLPPFVCRYGQMQNCSELGRHLPPKPCLRIRATVRTQCRDNSTSPTFVLAAQTIRSSGQQRHARSAWWSLLLQTRVRHTLSYLKPGTKKTDLFLSWMETGYLDLSFRSVGGCMGWWGRKGWGYNRCTK